MRKKRKRNEYSKEIVEYYQIVLCVVVVILSNINAAGLWFELQRRLPSFLRNRVCSNGPAQYGVLQAPVCRIHVNRRLQRQIGFAFDSFCVKKTSVRIGIARLGRPIWIDLAREVG